MNTICPSCRTEYLVTPADVGRRIVCSGCRKVLAVGVDGLHLDVEPVMPPGRLTDRLTRVRVPGEWATYVFAIGAMLVLWFVLMPFIGTANVERRTAALGEQSLDHGTYLKRLREQNATPRQITDAEEAWQKRREVLQDEVKQAEFSRGRSAYWDRYGLLFGYLVLAVGAIGWTRSGEPLVRRILGAVILTSQLLLAFQTVTPMGCSPSVRAYNSAANPNP